MKLTFKLVNNLHNIYTKIYEYNFYIHANVQDIQEDWRGKTVRKIPQAAVGL